MGGMRATSINLTRQISALTVDLRSHHERVEDCDCSTDTAMKLHHRQHPGLQMVPPGGPRPRGPKSRAASASASRKSSPRDRSAPWTLHAEAVAVPMVLFREFEVLQLASRTRSGESQKLTTARSVVPRWILPT